MQYVPSSLRAKRGNPEANAAQSGLLRRCAPRNDGLLRALASWGETNLLFSSREAAKTRRNLSAADVLRLLGHNMPPVGEMDIAE